MIQSFRNEGTRDVFDGRDSKAARRICPVEIKIVAKRKLNDLRVPPGNRLEPLKGDRRGPHSIRINDRYRVCFHWSAEGPEVVEIVDYHR